MNRAARSTLIGLGYILVYLALDAGSFVHPLLKLDIIPWDPDTGLTVAFLWTLGWRWAPWTWAAALLSEIFVHHAPGTLPTLTCASAVIALGYGVLAYELRRRHVDQELASLRAALQLSICAGLAAFAVAAAYAAVFLINGIIPAAAAVDAVTRNWVGDVNGILTVTPLVLVAPRFRRILPALKTRPALACFQATALVVLMSVVFKAGPSGNMPLYMLFAPAIWITLVWGVIGASAATLTIQIGLLIGAAPRMSAEPFMEAQYFLVTLALTVVFLGAVIVERARALARVAESEAEQRALLLAAPDAVLTADADGAVVTANIAAERLLNASASQIVGSPLSRWLPDLNPADLSCRRRSAGVRSDGVRFPAEVACVRLDAPARPRFLLIARDMTDHDLAQTQIRERDSALSRAMRFALAGELSTALTHELNQPITALVSYLKAVEIMGGALSSRDPRLLDTIRKAVREALRASNILKRLRDFYRGSDVKPSSIDMQGLVAETLSAFEDRAARLGAAISAEFDLKRSVQSDSTQLQMVLHNLIGNALDAVSEVPPGSRRVHVRVGLNDQRLWVSVEDSGRGVPLDIRGQLFEPFVTSKIDGMGLGLAISRSLMRSQGGDLRLDSSHTIATRFIVELPLAAGRQAA